MFFNLHPEVPSTETVTITYRNVKDIDMTKLCYFLETTITRSNPKDQSLNKCTEIYNEVLTVALDKFAPRKTRKIRKINKPPWFNRAIRNGIGVR